MSEVPIYKPKLPTSISPIVYGVAAAAVFAGIVVALTRKSTPPKQENYGSTPDSRMGVMEEQSWTKKYWWAIVLGVFILTFVVVYAFVRVLYNRDGTAEMLRINAMGLPPRQ